MAPNLPQTRSALPRSPLSSSPEQVSAVQPTRCKAGSLLLAGELGSRSRPLIPGEFQFSFSSSVRHGKKIRHAAKQFCRGS